MANSTSTALHSASSRTLDLEVKDAHLIFDSIWNQLESEYELKNLRFPKEIFWLNGAPGAGKGTQTNFIMKFRDLTAPPIVVSSLLKSPEAVRMMDAGLMVGDQEVTSLLFKKLLDPVCQSGAVLDGYPRTHVQVLCLKLLYQKLKDLRDLSSQNPLTQPFDLPVFHLIVLFIDEAESVRRQLDRGQGILKHNEQVRKSGMGRLVEVRKTDLAEEAARDRYRTFKEITYKSLQTLREVFHYHYINAHGTVGEVQNRIVDELRYQSSLELNEKTYDLMSAIPIASHLLVHSRQRLVKRLDDYERFHAELFKLTVDLLKNKFVPIIERHSISGMTYINSEDPIFQDPMALAMVIDVFSERGFHCAVDVRIRVVPDRIDPQNYKILCRKEKSYRFKIKFTGSEIRRDR
ncbi:MAG TPA: nucleoside monophosphate kinase [Verrucomicrobiales bacterium]|jgi:adenylate kinase|nr:nucleoside monophosphate kinase [Verrucomicrobiales bacterium]HIL70272.1 nucleoside monophosphate kinase [Verrucomicrobiota bacterium]